MATRSGDSPVALALRGREVQTTKKYDCAERLAPEVRKTSVTAARAPGCAAAQRGKLVDCKRGLGGRRPPGCLLALAASAAPGPTVAPTRRGPPHRRAAAAACHDGRGPAAAGGRPRGASQRRQSAGVEAPHGRGAAGDGAPTGHLGDAEDGAGRSRGGSARRWRDGDRDRDGRWRGGRGAGAGRWDGNRRDAGRGGERAAAPPRRALQPGRAAARNRHRRRREGCGRRPRGGRLCGGAACTLRRAGRHSSHACRRAHIHHSGEPAGAAASQRLRCSGGGAMGGPCGCYRRVRPGLSPDADWHRALLLSWSRTGYGCTSCSPRCRGRRACCRVDWHCHRC